MPPECGFDPNCTNRPGWVVTDMAGDDYEVCYDHLLRLITVLAAPGGRTPIGVRRRPGA